MKYVNKDSEVSGDCIKWDFQQKFGESQFPKARIKRRESLLCQETRKKSMRECP